MPGIIVHMYGVIVASLKLILWMDEPTIAGLSRPGKILVGALETERRR